MNSALVMPVAGPAARAEPPAAESRTVSPPSPPASDELGNPFAAIDGGRSIVLVDANGLLLAGSLAGPDGGETGDRVAAELAGVTREASRAGRLLGRDGGSREKPQDDEGDGESAHVRSSSGSLRRA